MKYKIVFTMSNGSTKIEPVEFICRDPLLAVKAYVNETLKNSSYVNGDVFPVVEETPVYTSGKSVVVPKPVESKLFGGYTTATPEVTPKPFGDVFAFTPPDSSWIKLVTWQSVSGMHGHLSIHFYDKAQLVYAAHLQDFSDFECDVITHGASAGHYYNKHIKYKLERV